MLFEYRQFCAYTTFPFCYQRDIFRSLHIKNCNKNKVKKNQTINIVDDQFRTSTNVHDLVKSIFVIINRKKTGVYHISSDVRLSIYDIVCKFVKKNGFDISLVNKISSKELKIIAQRPKDSSLNCRYAMKNLKYK